MFDVGVVVVGATLVATVVDVVVIVELLEADDDADSIDDVAVLVDESDVELNVLLSAGVVEDAVVEEAEKHTLLV